MKKLLLTSLLLSALISVADGQSLIALGFTARYEGLHKPLDSVRVENLTRDGDTTLYGSDTLLILSTITGTEGSVRGEKADFELLPSFPNPFSISTTLRVMVCSEMEVTLRAFDLLGRCQALLKVSLSPGLHSFTYSPGSRGHFILAAESPGHRSVQRILHTGPGSGDAGIAYNGLQGGVEGMRLEKSGFTWFPGDLLRMTGYATPQAGIPASDLVSEVPTITKVYTFQLQNGLPCEGVVMASDTSGNTYRTIAIGNQCWMRENLRATQYNDGSAIPLVPDGQVWAGLATGARCWFGNDSATWAGIYGSLYNWFAVDQGNLCPAGWRVPTDTDWLLLEDFLGGGTAMGGKLKAKGTTHWNPPNAGATNDVGFTALPGGFRDPVDGTCLEEGSTGSFWNATGHQPLTGWYRSLHAGHASLLRDAARRSLGLSVRCLRDDPVTVQLPVKVFFKASSTEVPVYTPVHFSDFSSGTPTTWKWYFGDGDSSTQQHPVHTYTATGPYTVTLIAGNSLGSDTLQKLQYMLVKPMIPLQVYDIDSNAYDTVQIGSQVWLKQNLRTTRYNNGVSIPLKADQYAWQASNPARCWFQNDSAAHALVYGSLYNGYAVATGQLCPVGYHIPVNAEWNTLRNYLGGEAVAGGAMKDTGTTYWASPNSGATNASRFKGLPGSYRSTSGYFYNAGYTAFFHSADTYSPTNGYCYALAHNATTLAHSNSPKTYGYSVRCIQDTVTAGCVLPTVVTDSVSNITTTTARMMGTVIWDGGTAVFARGICISTSPNPTIAGTHSVAGVNMGTFSSDFINLTVGTTYYVRAYATNAIGTTYGNQLIFNTVSSFALYDIDGFGYDTVHIGTQVWMKQNLRVTRYNNSAIIPKITYAAGWNGLNTPGMCWYGYDSATYSNTYGALYNWHVVNTGLLCPVGWHVPTDTEWSILDNYLGGLSVSGGAMKEAGFLHWNSPNTGATNSSGFLSLPGGNNGLTGSTGGLGNSAHYWTSTMAGVSTNAWARINLYNAASTTRSSIIVRYGYSVRCIQN